MYLRSTNVGTYGYVCFRLRLLQTATCLYNKYSHHVTWIGMSNADADRSAEVVKISHLR